MSPTRKPSAISQSARSRQPAQRDLAGRAGDHDGRHDQPAVDAGRRCAPTGKTPSAEPITIAEVNSGALSGDMPMSTAKIGPSANEAPFAAPARENREARERRHADEPQEARPDAARLGGRIDARHRHRDTIASASRAPATAKAENPPGPSGCSSHLAAGGGGEIGDLVERVERAAIGVGRLGVDPGFDHRVEAGEDEADQRAEDEPRRTATRTPA